MTAASSSSSGEILDSLDAVRQALLNRIPTEYREMFFTPFHPRALTTSDLKIADDQLERAVALIQTAILEQQAVLIYGDYDCDGVTSTAVLWQTLRNLGLTAHPFIPRRDVYGYGMSVKALEDLWKDHSFDLVITVDNGIVAHEAVSWLKAKGATVIVTDHHQPSETLPEADAIVHSTLLSGVGVAWALSRALAPEQADQHLDLVAIGTLADQVSLVGANRSLVKHGLTALRQTTRASLVALAELAGMDLASISANGVTFTLAPRINAMGRLADPMDALRALVSQSPTRIKELIATMERTNSQRQDLTQSMYQEVLHSLTPQGENLPSILVVTGPYHEGVIGLLASKLVEQFHRPAIVISTLNGVWKASCRSVPGFSIIAALRSLESVEFLSLGGHAMAAGFSLDGSKGNDLITQLKGELSEKYTSIALNSTSDNIGTLSFRLLIPELVRVIEEFEPFGSGNVEPHFVLKDIRFTSLQFVGKQKQHWKGSLLHLETGTSAPAIFFRAQEKYPQDASTIDQVIVRVVATSYGKHGFDVQIAQAFPKEN